MVKKNINLIPKDYYDKQKLKKFMRKMGTALVLIFSCCVLFVTIILHLIDVKTQEVYALNILIEDIKFIESQQVVEDIALRKEHIALSRNMATLLNDELGQEVILDIIVKNISNNMEFIELFYNRQERRLTTMIQTKERSAIPIFIDNLNNTGILDNVNIVNIINNDEGTVFLIEMFLLDNGARVYSGD